MISTFFDVTILFAIFLSSVAVSNRTNYLTAEDFARAKLLSSVDTNGTIFNTQNKIQIQKSIEGRNVWKYETWPNARVPYTLDPSFDNKQRAEIARAFENYHSKTCVRFVPKESTDDDYVEILRDDNICGLAHLCRIGGAQFAKFGRGCINSAMVSHALGHTLCFGHEQTRRDRDKYISWDTSKCTPHKKDNGTDFLTLDLLYDYVSLQHYEGECYDGCILPKIPGVTKCGSGGDLSVLDIEKINVLYKCGGCLSYRYRPISRIKNDTILVHGGTDVNGDRLYPCRGYFHGDIVVGKGNINARTCHVGYAGLEHELVKNFEILTNPKNVNINWIRRPNQSLPLNAIRGGRSAEREPLYIGRCTLAFHGKVTTMVGKIHKSASSGLYVTYAGKEYICKTYEILVCHLFPFKEVN